MFLQHWATCSCHRPSVEQTISVAGVAIPSCPEYKKPISSDCFDLAVQDVGIRVVKCCTQLTQSCFNDVLETFRETSPKRF